MTVKKMIHFNTLSCEPVLRRAANGDLVVVSQCGGPCEPHAENRVYVFRSEDDGAHWDNHNNGGIWGKGKLIVPDDGRAVYQTGVFAYGSELWCFLTLHDGGFLDWEHRIVKSIDFGKTWTDAGVLPCFSHEFVFMRVGVVLQSGRIIFPYTAYNVKPEQFSNWTSGKRRWLLSADVEVAETGAIFSDDGGVTFVKGRPFYTDMPMLPRRVWKWTEPTLAELGDGSVVMLFRQDGTGLLWKSVSTDFGESWSEPVSSGIPNPGNKPKLLQDGRGRIILIHTPNAEKDKRFPLQVWVSEDDMRSWSRKITVESGEGFFCYPDGYVTEDNKKVRFTYENRHDIFLVETELDDGTETCVRGNRGKRGCE